MFDDGLDADDGPVSIEVVLTKCLIFTCSDAELKNDRVNANTWDQQRTSELKIVSSTPCPIGSRPIAVALGMISVLKSDGDNPEREKAASTSSRGGIS